jgi:hypothetical protein
MAMTSECTQESSNSRSAEVEANQQQSHTVTGDGMETVVVCQEKSTEYGPGTDDSTRPEFCMYCSDETSTDEHRLATMFDEVFCDAMPMDGWTYCPGCGERISQTRD